MEFYKNFVFHRAEFTCMYCIRVFACTTVDQRCLVVLVLRLVWPSLATLKVVHSKPLRQRCDALKGYVAVFHSFPFGEFVLGDSFEILNASSGWGVEGCSVAQFDAAACSVARTGMLLRTSNEVRK